MKQRSMTDEPYEITVPCIRVEQPIGAFFVAAIDWKLLREITFYDVRRLADEREIDTYLGIQREVDPKRVKELHQYVNTIDACFPTSVILAVRGECAEFDAAANKLTLRSLHDENNDPIVNRFEIARVLDGQHRIEGLGEFHGEQFQINVSIFVEMDLPEQAYLFSVVNLAQTKVKRSLVYDLFEFSRLRSPQKAAHNIAVALDSLDGSPFHRRIKRLGTATPGRTGETLTQAAFVEAVMVYMTKDAVLDRDTYKRGKSLRPATEAESRDLIFRNLFLEEKDMIIADILLAYFTAARSKWPIAWSNPTTGYILGKTNGFRSLMRLLKHAYLSAVRGQVGHLPQEGAFDKLFQRVTLVDADFVSDRFLPGTGGEANLYHTMYEQMFPSTQARLN